MMNVEVSLFLVFLLLYILEGSKLIISGAVVFTPRLFKKHEFSFTRERPAFGKKRLTFQSLLPSTSCTFVCAELPVFISPEGVVRNPSFNDGFIDNYFFRHEEISRVAVGGTDIFINDLKFLTFSSGEETRFWKDFLVAVAKEKKNKRKKIIDEFSTELFSSEKFESRYKMFSGEIKFLVPAVIILWIYSLFVIPVNVIVFGLEVSWFYLFAGLLFCHTVTLFFSYRVHVSLYGKEKRADRILQIFTGLIYTPGLLRIINSLSSNYFFGFHPLTAARRFCSSEDYEKFFSRSLRDVTFFNLEGVGAEAESVIAWHSRIIVEEMKSIARKDEINFNQLIAPPEREQDEMISFCPRCHCQYSRIDGVCSDCQVKLAPFDNRN